MNTLENLSRAIIATPEESLQSFDRAGDAQSPSSQSLWPSSNAAQNLVQLSGTPAAPASQNLAQILLATVGASTNPTVGTATSALTGNGNTLPDESNMPFYVQKDNSCGTTTLAEIMSYLGVPMTQADVDSAIRRMNTFTAPNDMIDFAHSKGLEAEGYNNGTWDEVKSMIDAGHPVQAMVDGDSSVSVNDGATNFSVDGLHYIAITGYGTDPATGEEFVTYHDPNRSSEQKMSVSDFEKMWGGVPGGFNNYFVGYGAPGSSLPPGRDDGIQSTLGLLDGVTNVTNGLDRIISPDSVGGFLHGIPQLFGGAVQTVGCFGGALLQLGAGWLNNAVDGIPVLQNIVQPFGDLINGAGAAFSDLCNGVGEAADDFGGAIESLGNGDFGGFVSGVGSAAEDVGKGVVDAVGDAASAVGDAVSDIFSGW